MVYIPFEDRANNYHVIFLGEVLKELSRLSINGLGKLTPPFFTCSEGKRHCPGFLQFRDMNHNK
jgi:hypothetical protein